MLKHPSGDVPLMLFHAFLLFFIFIINKEMIKKLKKVVNKQNCMQNSFRNYF
ncbi:hypothetical Protein psc1_03520 [Candidatus Phytoplasma solani]